ncbi:MAG: FAD-dependent monooxygenase [Cyanobacteriota bacterium]|nr:FAD-dependent monooxygenase [Cyanobacteriota bacterium]
MVVVGAGPAGAAAALALARCGQRVHLVEARPHAPRRWRGEALMPSGLAALDQLGLLPLAADVPQRALRSWAMLLDGQLLFDAPEPLGSPQPCTLVEQTALLTTLRQAAQHGVMAEQGTCQWHAGQAVSQLLEHQGRICGVELADGHRIPADLVIGCDGRDSRLRQWTQLPLEREPSPLQLGWFDLDLPALAPLHSWLAGRFVTVLAQEGSFALFGSATDRLQLGWLHPPGRPPAPPPGGWPELWARCLPASAAAPLRALAGATIPEPVPLAVRVGLAPQWHRPGLLLLGDAVHPMSPLRAQGISMALRDAVVAANLLAPALASGNANQIDAALPTVAAARLEEIRTVQRLQRLEAARGELLRQRPLLRRWLGLNRSWAGPLAQRHWIHQQRQLRDGVLPLPQGPP